MESNNLVAQGCFTNTALAISVLDLLHSALM